MATSSLPSVDKNPFLSFSDDDRILMLNALSAYEAVLKRRVNAEKNDRIREIVEMDLARVRVLMSNSLEK